MRLNFFLIKKGGIPILLIKRYYNEPAQVRPVQQFNAKADEKTGILEAAQNIQERVEQELA